MTAVDTVRAAMALSDADVARLTGKHLNGRMIEALSLFGYLRRYARAEGMHLWDTGGRRYLDFLAGYGSISLGHNPPEVRAALDAVLGANLPHFPLAAPEALPAALAERLARLCPGDLEVSFFSSSGSEAVDGALKLARAATHRPRLVHASGAYHGATFGALSVTSGGVRRAGGGPLLPGAVEVPWSDAGAVERELRRRDVAAVILEPLQAEGGFHLPAPGYLAEVARLCRRYGALLILDEVQTGLGRTGAMFACEREGVIPDVMVLAKGLSGGMVPVSAYVTRADLWRRAYGSLERHEAHCTTFRGGPLASAAALATLEIIERDRLAERAAVVGEQLGRRLREVTAGHPLVREVRGRGLLWGIEVASIGKGLTAAWTAQWLVVGLLERGIVTQVASLAPGVVRFEPPLVCEREHVDAAADALRGALAEHATGKVQALAAAASRLVVHGASALRGALRP